MNILITTVSSGKESRFHNGTGHILELAVSNSILQVFTMSMSKISLGFRAANGGAWARVWGFTRADVAAARGGGCWTFLMAYGHGLLTELGPGKSIR